MKTFNLLIIISLTASMMSCSNKTPKLDTEDDKRITIRQRDSKIIDGNKEKIELRLGDITYGSVDVEITGQKSNTQFLHINMQEGDRQIFDYYGTKYLLNVLHFENHVVHDDKAEISFRKISNQEAENLKQLVEKEHQQMKNLNNSDSVHTESIKHI